MNSRSVDGIVSIERQKYATGAWVDHDLFAPENWRHTQWNIPHLSGRR